MKREDDKITKMRRADNKITKMGDQIDEQKKDISDIKMMLSTLTPNLELKGNDSTDLASEKKDN